jgi:hypothetical protein
MSQSPTPFDNQTRQELLTLLNARTVSQLRAIARARGFSLKGTRKQVIVEQMADLLSDPESIQAALSDLDPAGWLALEVVFCVTTSELGATEIEVGQVLERFSGNQHAGHDALAHLAGLGLILTTPDVYGGPERLIFPRAFAPDLPPTRELLPAYADPIDLLRVRPAGDGLTWPTTLYLIWQRLRDQGVTLRPGPSRTSAERAAPGIAGWPVEPAEVEAVQRKPGWQYTGVVLTVPAFEPELDDASLERLRPLAGGDVDRADFAYHLLRGLNAVNVKRDTLQVDESAILDFLRLDPMARLKALSQAWLGLNAWSELNLVLKSVGRIRLRRKLGYSQFKVQQLLDELTQARQFVARVLGRAEPGRWISLPGFLHAVWALNPDFLHVRRPFTLSEPIWWLEHTVSGRAFSLKDEADWVQGPGEFVIRLLTGPLHWLGAVDLGYDGHGLSAVRLTPLGALLLDRPSSFVLEPVRRPLEISDDLEITVGSGQGDSSVYEMLGRVGELVGADMQAFHYRLTRERLYAAFESGLVLGDLLDWLEDHSARPLPDAVVDQLSRWWASYGRVRLYPDLTVIEFADDYTLPELLATTALHQSIVHTVSPRLVIIRTEDTDALLSELVARGYTPKLTEGGQ